MKETNPTYKKERRRWAEEDVLQLAHHFHKFNNKSQYERVSKYLMKEEYVKEFDEKREKIESINICLALNEKDTNKLTFFPILRVVYGGDVKEERYYKLDPHESIETKSGAKKAKKLVHRSAEVPKIFKEAINKNWNEVEFNLIDDLFIAIVDGKPVRVLHYVVGNNVIEAVIKKLVDIQGITFYLGLDMNKFSNKEQISFTPVLGFKYTKTKKLKSALEVYEALEFLPNSKVFSKGKFGEVFIEYSSPCPPTC